MPASSLAYPNLVRIAVGSNAQASYVAFPAAPHYEGLQYPRRNPDGSFDGLPFADLIFRGLDGANLTLTLTRAGLATASVASVTIRLPDKSRVGYADWNGQAMQPAAARDMHFDILRYPDVLLRVRKLKAAS